MALPAVPYPATIEVHQIVDDKASVAFRGNRYSVAPGLAGSSSRSGTGSARRASRSSRPPGTELVSHRLARAGAGADGAHRPRTGPPSKRWCSASSAPLVRVTARPTSLPGEAALAERARLLGAGRVPSRVSISTPWPRSSPWPFPGPPRPRRHRHERELQVPKAPRTPGLLADDRSR